jgi:Rieske Fe-S protein
MHDHATGSSAPADHQDRRTFLKWLTQGLGALFGLILGVPAVAYLIDARNRPAPKGGMRRVAKLTDLEIGKPRQFVIHDIRRDAWTLHPDDVVGRVWLIRRDQKNVDAFTTICPHLGCSVDWRGDRKLFICPCHGGTFKPDGDLVKQANNPAPRGMDSLELEIDNEGYIAVKYQNFIQGKEEKVLKT